MSRVLFVLIISVFLFSAVFYWITVLMRRKFSGNKAMPYIPFVIVFSVFCNLIMFLLYGWKEYSGYGFILLLLLLGVVLLVLLLSSVFGVVLGLRATRDKH